MPRSQLAMTVQVGSVEGVASATVRTDPDLNLHGMLWRARMPNLDDDVEGILSCITEGRWESQKNGTMI